MTDIETIAPREQLTHTEIITQIQRLTLIERLELVELAIQQIRGELAILNTPATQTELSEDEAFEQAVEIMLPEYTNNEELTIFTRLNNEDFYVEEPDLVDRS